MTPAALTTTARPLLRAGVDAAGGFFMPGPAPVAPLSTEREAAT